ncbi:glycoside hydrolase family 13 protein, partial [Escherichia coli]|nr:glycoside hydrolase family 13 protein [Escherichia coli]
VDPHLGGNIAFHTLIEEAHKRGIKIMLDAVFNHLGADSPIWLDVVRNGANSRYADWFWIHKFPVYPDTPKSEWDFKNFNYETFGNVIEMPKLNTENEECREYLLSIVRYWTQNFDIDGWRLDVANEVDHHFWRDFRKVIKDIKPECYILGEIWHEGTPWLRGDQFDSLMNYPLTYGIIDYFALQDTTKQEFMTSVTRSYLCYPKNITEVMFNLLDSHDTARILSVCLNDKRKVKLAYLFMLTQAGSPCIYYGSEIGIDGFKSMTLENNRKCMIWDENKQDLELRQFIRWLIRLRKKHPQWCVASIQWKDVEHPTVIAYQRDNITFFLNNSEDTANFIYDGRSMEISGFSYEIEGLPAADLYDF